MSTASWTSVVTRTDVPAAELPTERLRSEGVCVEIRSDGFTWVQQQLDCVLEFSLPRFSECIRVHSERSSDTGLHPHNVGI